MSPLPHPIEDGPQFQFTSLTGADRHDIVDLSANFNNAGAAFVKANHLELTALGANADLDGRWDDLHINLVAWRHLATSGRDHYVKVVRRGYLFPFGHRAVEVTVVERILDSDPVAGRFSDAHLRLQRFIKVIEPTKAYPAVGQPFAGRSWPFASVEITSLITPPIVLYGLEPAPSPNTPSHSNEVYLGQSPFQWKAVAVDQAGHRLHLQIPQLFVFGYDQDVPAYASEFNEATAVAVATLYRGLPAERRQATIAGEVLQFAPEAGGKVGATTHPVLQLTLDVATPSADPSAQHAVGLPVSEAALALARQPAWYPVLATARVRLPAADALSRGTMSDSGGAGVAIEPFWRYVEQGLPNASNPGTVYAQLADAAAPGGTPPMLTFPADAVGGIGTPNVGLTGLSAKAGTVAGPLDTYATLAKQDPAAFFALPGQKGPELPQLLGGISLASVLGSFLNEHQMPALVHALDPVTGARTVSYSLVASLKDIGIFVPHDKVNGQMRLNAVLTIAPGKPPTYTIDGTVDPFDVVIIGTSDTLNFITIPFEQFTFHAGTGAKPSTHPVIGQVSFNGSLTFVNALADFLADLGLGSGFKVAVTDGGINAAMSMGLPSISMGMVSIEHLGLSAAIDVPFSGAPATATFSFASQEQHFLVTVSMFGGGGYVTLVLGLTSVQRVSVQIEFAGNFSLDIGVASGGITLTAGINYLYDAVNGVTLTGFVKLHGELDVLGIISISIELDLELQYHSDANGSSVIGTATLEISVHVIFFSVGVSVSVTKQFAGSSSHGEGSHARRLAGRHDHAAVWPPAVPAGDVVPATFDDLVADLATWSTYCSAFAG